MNNFQRHIDPLISMKLGDPWKNLVPGTPVRVKKSFSTSHKNPIITSYSKNTLKYSEGRILYVEDAYQHWSLDEHFTNALNISGEFKISFRNRDKDTFLKIIKADLKKFKEYLEILDK